VTTVNPTVVLGNVTILPSPSDSIVSSVNPTVVLGSVSISPDALTSIVLSIDPSVVGGSVVVSPTAIYAIAKTVGASVPEQQTALRFNYNATFVDFRMDELRLVEVTHIQKADQFWDQDNKFHQYFVGKLFKKIRIVFRQDDSDTYGKIETIWNQVDTYNQPKNGQERVRKEIFQAFSICSRCGDNFCRNGKLREYAGNRKKIRKVFSRSLADRSFDCGRYCLHYNSILGHQKRNLNN